jgi:hypothetical protein
MKKEISEFLTVDWKKVQEDYIEDLDQIIAWIEKQDLKDKIDYYFMFKELNLRYNDGEFNIYCEINNSLNLDCKKCPLNKNKKCGEINIKLYYTENWKEYLRWTKAKKEHVLKNGIGTD